MTRNELDGTLMSSCERPLDEEQTTISFATGVEVQISIYTSEVGGACVSTIILQHKNFMCQQNSRCMAYSQYQQILLTITIMKQNIIKGKNH